MNAKLKCGILAFAICAVVGAAICLTTIVRSREKPTVTVEKPPQVTENIEEIVTKETPDKAVQSPKKTVTGEKPGQTTEKEMLIREKLLQAVENAKRGDWRELDTMIEFVERDRGRYVTEKMLPDFISFLNEKDGQIQLLGAKGLYVLKSPKSKEALFEYLKGKDFAKLEEMRSTNQLDTQQELGQIRASALAIVTLGKLGDKSAIPLLESIRQKANLEFEWGFSPVEEALAELGAVEILSSIPPGSDERQIRRAAHAIRKIRDPNKAPELMTIVYDVNCAPPIRDSALRALGKINTVGVHEFLLRLINDSQIPVLMRGTAVITAAQTGNEMFEETLLEIADSNSEIRIEGLCGLTLLKPDKYLKNIFRMIRDEKEPDEFRNTLAARFILYIPWQQKRQMLESQKDELYACLNTNKTGGSPHDEMRVRIWCLINELFGEEPTLVLNSKSPKVTSHLRHPIETKIIMSNPHLSHEETTKKIDEKINTIVQVYEPPSEKEKKDE